MSQRRPSSLEILLDRSNYHFWIIFFSINLLHLFCLYMRSSMNSSNAAKYNVVDLMVWLVDLSFVNVCLFSKTMAWREMAVEMEKAHGKLKKRGEGDLKIATIPYWMLILFFSMFSFDVWYYCTDPILYKMFIKYICLRTTKVFKIVSTGLMYSALNVLKGQVEVLKEKFEEVRTKEELDQVKLICLKLQKSVRSFNECFRWQLFLLFCNLGFSVLLYLSVFAMERFVGITARWIISIVLSLTYVVFEGVMTVRIIAPAEVLYRFPVTLDKACHLIVLTRPLEPSLKEEFLSFSQSIQVMNTTISAAGFYHINKRLMSGFVSVTTSYFIVYLQMKK